MDPVLKAMIARFEEAGFVYEEQCDFDDEGQIKWQAKFDEIEKEYGHEIGFDEFMSCDFEPHMICLTSVRSSEVHYFDEYESTDDLIDAVKATVEKFYRDL